MESTESQETTNARTSWQAFLSGLKYAEKCFQHQALEYNEKPTLALNKVVRYKRRKTSDFNAPSHNRQSSYPGAFQKKAVICSHF